MNTLTQEITDNAALLSDEEQKEALDFIKYLQAKSARHFNATITNQKQAVDSNNVSRIYQAFEQAGLIGCIETDEQLSTNYKEKWLMKRIV